MAIETSRGLLVTALRIGAGRAQQNRQRAQMRGALPFARTDLLIDCADAPPLHPECPRVRGEAISPYEEPLFLPFSRLTG